MKNSLFKILLFVLSVSIIFFAISCKNKSKESAPSVNPPSVSTPTESESVEESEFESKTDSQTSIGSESQPESESKDEQIDVGTEGLVYELINEGTEYSVVDYDGDETDVVIPSTYLGITVTSIGESAFEGCASLISVEIGDSVAFIGDYAFYHCDSLKSVEIGNSVTAIGENAFRYCNSLTSVEIPDSVITIGDWAFYDCDSLTSVVIGGSVTTIGDSAFYNCFRLTNITVNENNSKFKSIDGNLYSKDGTVLIQYAIGKKDISFVIPDSVSTIGDYAFYNCGLISIEISDSVTTIGEWAFADCFDLISVEIGDSVTTIGESAFADCFNLTSVEIPNSVTTIGEWAFADCFDLISVEIGDSVTTIGNLAFFGCYKLVEVINKSTLTIKKGATDTGKVGYYALSVSNREDDYKSKLSNDNGYIVYTDGEEKILVGYDGKETELVLPSYITKINQYAFISCFNITSVEIGDSVTAIGDYAFFYCGLTSIELPDSVTTIGEWAFADCFNLTSIEIGVSVAFIGDYAFNACVRLVEVINKSRLDIEKGSDSYGYVGYFALSVSNREDDYKSKLSNDNGYIVCTDGEDKILVGYNGEETDLILPAYITKINQNAFDSCFNLTSVVIGNSVTSIGNYAFYGCGLTSVYYNGTLSEWIKISIGGINSSLFFATIYYYSEEKPTTSGNYWYYDENGEVAIWKSESSSLGTEGLVYNLINDTEYSVVGYDGIERDVVIPPAYLGIPVTSIDKEAFSNCSHLTSIEISNSVTTIGDLAFFNCDSLTSVEIPEGVIIVGEWVFNNCSSLTNIIVDENNGKYKSIDGNLYSKDGTVLIQYAIGKNDTEFTIPDSVTTVGKRAFYGCDGLTSVIIGDNVTTIDEYAFYKCDSLTIVVIGDSVTTIGDYAFAYCDSLTSVEIGDSVTTIGSFAFSDCDSLTSVNYMGTIDQWVQISFGNSYSNPIRYANELKIQGEVVTDVKITTATKISNYAFYHYCSLTSVEIPDSVTSIGSSAFVWCNKLVEVINKSNLDIEKGSESYGCVGLYALSVSNREDNYKTKLSNDNGYIVYTDGEDKILVGYNGKEIDLILPAYTTKIYQYAFYNRDSLTSVVIGDSVTSIGYSAFSYCDSLTSVVIGDSVTIIGGYAFAYCYSLTSVYYKGSATDWDKISIGGINSSLFSATIYYYIEEKPTTSGNDWYYDENGEIKIW